MHTHIGTTVFNNFSKSYPYRWGLDSAVAQELTQSLTGAGFEVVDLEKEGVRFSDVSPLAEAEGGTWRIVPGKESRVPDWKRQGLRAIVVVKEGEVMADIECLGGPCSERDMYASGLFTRSFFGATRYKAVAAFQLNLVLLDPVADLAKAGALNELMMFPAVPMSRDFSLENFSQASEADLAPVRAAVLAFSKKMGDAIVKTLALR